MSAAPTIPVAPSVIPLRVKRDQSERWIEHARPLSFEEAAQIVLDAHDDDGERDDVVAHDLRAWAFGGDNGAMALVPLPLPGRASMMPLHLRELGFAQLCQGIGARLATCASCRRCCRSRT